MYLDVMRSHKSFGLKWERDKVHQKGAQKSRQYRELEGPLANVLANRRLNF